MSHDVAPLRCLGARLKPGVLRRAAGAADEGAVTLRVALGAADGPPTAAELVRLMEHEQPALRALLESLRVPAVIGGAAAGSQLLVMLILGMLGVQLVGDGDEAIVADWRRLRQATGDSEEAVEAGCEGVRGALQWVESIGGWTAYLEERLGFSAAASDVLRGALLDFPAVPLAPAFADAAEYRELTGGGAWSPPNAHGLQSVTNFRDVAAAAGPLADGQQLRPGLLYRSGLLSFATASDMDVLARQLRIRLYIDLRNRERDGVADGIAYNYFSPSPAGRPTPGSAGRRVTVNLHPSSAEIAAAASRKASAEKKAKALRAKVLGSFGGEGDGGERRERTAEERSAASFLCKPPPSCTQRRTSSLWIYLWVRVPRQRRLRVQGRGSTR